MLSNLLKMIKDFIGNRYQQVALNRKNFWMECSECWSPLGFFLASLLFLVSVNDPLTGLSSTLRLLTVHAFLFSMLCFRKTKCPR